MKRRIFCKVLLVVVAIFGLLVLSGVLSAQGRSDWALEHVKDVQDRHTDELMARPGVVGTAVGLGQNERLAIKVLLEKPGVGGIPAALEGVPVQPVITGKIYALPKPEKPGNPPKPEPEPPVDPTGWFERPVPIGVSTGNANSCSAGTIACRVKKGGNVYALSNNHVYALENTAPDNSEILQPGLYDTGCKYNKDNAIGTLDAFVKIDFDSGDNIVDAAIALSSTDNLGKATPSDGYGTPKSTTATALINQPVKKYGRTTGLTKGRVYALNATVNVEYSGGKVARFVGQIIITPGGFSAGGDSGSLVVVDGKGRSKADDRKPVGLLFAGSSLVTIANPIDAVLTELGVTIDGE